VIKKLVFDFDGTLADTRNALREVFDRVSTKYRLPYLSDEDVERMRKLPIKERFKEWGVPVIKLPLIFRDFRRAFDELEMVASPYPGIKDMVNSLNNYNLMLSIISSNSPHIINKFLKDHQLEVFDQVISTSGLFGKHRSLGRLLKQDGLNREEALYVGDELRDIEACRKVPIRVIAASWGYDALSLLEQGEPDFLVHEPRDIPPLVENLNCQVSGKKKCNCSGTKLQ